jgi:hypothetical protein
VLSTLSRVSRGAVHELLERMGPQGGFVRDAWPLLLLSALVALVSLLSFSWPVLGPLLMPAIASVRALLKRTIRPLGCVLLLASAAAAAEDAWLLHMTTRPRLFLRAWLRWAVCSAPLVTLALLTCSPLQIGSGADTRDVSVARMAKASQLVGALVAAAGGLALVLTGEVSLDKECCSSQRQLCAGLVRSCACLAWWMALGLLAAATESSALAALAGAPVRALAFAAQAFDQLVCKPARAISRLARQRWLSLCGLSLVVAAGALQVHLVGPLPTERAAAQATLLTTRPIDAYAQCKRAAFSIKASLHQSPLPVLLLRKLLAAHTGACTGGVLRALAALLAALAGAEIIANDLLEPTFMAFPHSARRHALSCALSGPMSRILKVVLTPPPPIVRFVRDGLGPLALGVYILSQVSGGAELRHSPPPDGRRDGLEVAVVVTSADDGLWPRLLDGFVGATLAAVGTVVCWRSPLGPVVRGRARLTAAASATADAIARFLDRVWHDRMLPALRRWFVGLRLNLQALYRLTEVCLLASWERLVRPATDAIVNCSRRAASVCSQLVSRLVAVARHATAHAWRMLTACGRVGARACAAIGRALSRASHVLRNALAKAYRALCSYGVRAYGTLRLLASSTCRWVWRRLMVPAGRACLSYVLRPMLHWVLKPLLIGAERHWPLVSCIYALASAALFASAAAVAISSNRDVGRASSQSVAAPVADAIGPALGSFTSGTIGILLAGHGTGSARLRRLGEAGMRHVDLGTVQSVRTAGGALLRASCVLFHMVAAQLGSLWTLAARAGMVILSGCYHVGSMAMRTALVALRLLTSLTDKLIARPLGAVWRSPTASLAASVLAAAGAFVLHRSGGWAYLSGPFAAAPAVLWGHVDALLRGGVAGAAQAAVRFPTTVTAYVPALLSPTRTFASGAAALTHSAIDSGVSALDSIESAFASATTLHGQPLFGFAVWLLFVAIVGVTNPSMPPPRALAFAFLCSTLYFHTGSARYLPLVMVAVGMYLYGSALAAATAARAAAQARERQERAFASILRTDNGTESLANALAGAPQPEKVFASEDCVICLEKLAEEPPAEETQPDEAASAAVKVPPTEPAAGAVTAQGGARGWPWFGRWSRQKNGAAADAPAETLTPDAPRSCSACTFLCHDSARRNCEMCETVLPPHPPNASSSSTPLQQQQRTAEPSARDAPKALTTLRCGHVYHAECLAMWIKTSTGGARCPTCIQPIHLSRALLEGAMGVRVGP